MQQLQQDMPHLVRSVLEFLDLENLDFFIFWVFRMREMSTI